MELSAIVRCKNKEDTVEATLESLRKQTEPVEIVVVDSGSQDRTLEIARRHADRIVTIAPERFTFGGALNLGAASASGDVLMPVSAHCVLPDREFAGRVIRHFEDGRVGATNGAAGAPGGRRLTVPYRQQVGDVVLQPEWGFSNHAGAWRREAWKKLPFDETLSACEDKEWSWRALAAGWDVVYDPTLQVSSDHRRSHGLKDTLRRSRVEAEAMTMLGVYEASTISALLRTLWSDRAPSTNRPQAVHRLNPHRAMEILGKHLGSLTTRRAVRSVDDILADLLDGARVRRPRF